MIRLLLRAAPARLRAAPALGALPVAVIALGAGAVLSVQLLNRAALETLDAGLELVSGSADLVITGLVEEPGSVPDEAWPAALGAPGVARAAPALRLPLRVGAGGTEVAVAAWGVDIVAAPMGMAGTRGEGARLSAEIFFSGGVFIPARVADQLGVGIGDPVEVGLGVGGGRAMRVAGIFPGAEGAPALLDLAHAQALRGRTGFDRIEVAVAEGFAREEVRARLLDRIPGVRVEESGVLRAEGAELFAAFRWNLLALSTVSLMVAAFLVYASVRAALAARRQEFGLYRALGASAGRVRTLLFGEVLLLALAGAGLGIPVGALTASASLERVSATITNFYLLDRIERVGLDPQAVVVAAVLAVGAALLGAAPQVFAETSRAPVALLAPGRAAVVAARGWVRRGWPAAVGIALVAAATWAALDTDSWFAALAGGFGAAALLLTGAALLPGGALRLASRWRAGWVSGWHSAVGRGIVAAIREPGSTGPPAAALVVAVAMLVGVSSLIGSFRATLDSWLGETLVADIYLSRAGGPGRIAAERRALSAEALAVTAAEPAVRERDLLRALRVRLDGRPVSVLGVDAALANAGDRFSIPSDRDAALRAFRNGGALISEPLSRRLALEAGDSLVLPATGAAGAAGQHLPVAGVYRDFGNEMGALFLDRGLMNRLYPPPPGEAPPVHGIALYLHPETDRAEIAARLAAALGADANIVDNASLRMRALSVFDQTMAVTGLLRVFALAIAALGMTLFLWTLARERAPEAALNRALGASRGQVAAGIFGRGSVIVGLALLIGGGAGAVLTLLLVRVVNPAWFGWTLELHWPVGALAAQAAAVALTGVLAAVLPARRASRMDATALRQEI